MKSMRPRPDGAFQFGAHVFDPHTGRLTRGGERVPLQDRPLELLALLLEHAGEIVTREQIRARLWPDTAVEYDLSINYGIRQIRIALGPEADCIHTVARQGYRFVGAVTRMGANARLSYRRAAAAAAAVLVAFSSGFGAGVLARDAAVGQFVYAHLVHPDRCPYIRMLMPFHRNS
jgi:DNA-binding winged helix-turn-helix (wHTH) protein